MSSSSASSKGWLRELLFGRTGDIEEACRLDELVFEGIRKRCLLDAVTADLADVRTLFSRDL